MPTTPTTTTSGGGTATHSGTSSSHFSTRAHRHLKPLRSQKKKKRQGVSIINSSKNMADPASSPSSVSTSSSPQQSLKLNPEAIRRRVTSIRDCVEVPSSDKSALSFLLLSSKSSNNSTNGSATTSQPARVTIYCDTGTIATGRVLCGTVRHVFRKNVTTLDVVERCLREPMELTTMDWNLVGIEDAAGGAAAAVIRMPGELRPYQSPGRNLELIDVGLAILTSESEKLVQHVRSLEPTLTKPSPSGGGMEFQFSLSAGPMKHVDQCLHDIHTMGKLVKGVATNGTGTVFLYGNGGVAYTPNIPRALYHRLSQLRHSKQHSSRPSYVSLGTRERYFVAFHDGTFSYKGPKGLDKELRKLSAAPRSVAFGSTYDTFFLVFNDGSWKYQGRGIPTDLEEKLLARKARTELACVTMGPGSEWFLRSQEGRVGWGGVSDGMDESIQDLLDDGHKIKMLDFGENGSYFVSYD